METSELSGYWIKGDNNKAPYLRKTFELTSVPKKAIVNLCGLGWHELYINGKKADDRVLAPVVTQFDKHVCYIEYDVADLLQAGKNAITVLLGNGWYNCQTEEVWNFVKAPWRDHPKMLCELICDEKKILHSDESWKTHPSPIAFNALRNGETYDAREEVSGILEVDVNDSDWENVTQTCPPGGLVIKEQLEPCKVMKKFDAISETWVSGNAVIYDFGANMTGWCEVELEGEAGAHIKIQYSEMVRDNMDIDRAYIDRFVKSDEFQTDCYYLKGDGTEIWQPRFTYHGFRYAKVLICCGNVKIKKIRACFVHNSFPQAGTFECANETINQLQEITCQSYLSNFTGIPTDCPQREKNGWTGDAQLACETGLWNYNAKHAYKHFERILADTQRPSGQLPGIAPSGGWGYNWGSGPAWDICLFELAYQVYRFTGDTDMIKEHYGALHKYVDYCTGMAHDGLVKFGLGDWCHFDDKRRAPVEMTSSAYYYYAAKLFSTFAALLGNNEDRAKYESLSGKIAERINSKFANPDGTYADGQWTALACALYFRITPEDKRQKTADVLAEKVKANGCKADFGILGAKYTPRVLADYGYADLAFRLLTQPEFPGWAHWLNMGATTLWENWSGVASRNHIMFGDISAWMYEYLAGISPDDNHPGFKHFSIRPRLIEGLTWVKAKHRCEFGEISVSWQTADREFKMDVTIPPSTSATLTLPDGTAQKLDSGNHSVTTRI